MSVHAVDDWKLKTTPVVKLKIPNKMFVPYFFTRSLCNVHLWSFHYHCGHATLCRQRMRRSYRPASFSTVVITRFPRESVREARPIISENVISSVWPINVQYHSQAAATGV